MDLSRKHINPFTLIYLVCDNKVLLLKRLSTKKLLGGKIIGLGGKIELGEDVLESAKREFSEETGLELLNPNLKGTYTWIDNNFIGISHLIVATKYTGELIKEGNEGHIEWYDIDKLNTLENLAVYQKNFLPHILTQEYYHYTGIGIFNDDELISYTDTKGYFTSRNK